MATATLRDEIPKGILTFNASRVGMLQSSLHGLDGDFRTIPGLLRTIAEGECWRSFKFPDSDVVRWNAADFRRFIESPRPGGCATPIHVLERAVRGTDAWEVYQELIRGEKGNPTGTNQYTTGNRDNVTVSSEPTTIPLSQGLPRVRDFAREAPTGNSTSYALRQLERGKRCKDGSELAPRPDLLEKVKAGALTPHAAAVQAGYRQPKITLPVEPEAAVRLIVKHFKGDALTAVIRGLANWAGVPLADEQEVDAR